MNESKMYKITFSVKADPSNIDEVKASLTAHLEKLKMFGDIEDCSIIIVQ